jgi:hypothetical protein
MATSTVTTQEPELQDRLVKARRMAVATAAVALTATAMWLSHGFVFRGNSEQGLGLILVLSLAAVIMAATRWMRKKPAPVQVPFARFPEPVVMPPPDWDAVAADGVPALLPEKSTPRIDHRRPAPLPPDKATLEQAAARIAAAYLDGGGDGELPWEIRILSDEIVAWPRMSAAEADRRFGTPAAVAENGTRAYATLRADGRGVISLLRRDGHERVLRIQWSPKRVKRRRGGAV